jgi:hypothetical protein
MYLAIVILLMGVLPVGSILVEHFGGDPAGADWWGLIGKWFVFWSVGVRLATAGLRQIVQPAFTAKEIFEIEDDRAQIVVQELGFANLAIGVLAVLTQAWPEWTVAAALVGALFYGLAGARHVLKGGQNRNEMIATVSDIFIFIVLAAYLIAVSLQPD